MWTILFSIFYFTSEIYVVRGYFLLFMNNYLLVSAQFYFDEHEKK